MSGEYIIGFAVASALAWAFAWFMRDALRADWTGEEENRRTVAALLVACVLLGVGTGAAAVSGAVVAGLECGR